MCAADRRPRNRKVARHRLGLGAVLLFLLLLAGVSAVACPRGDSHPQRHLASAVIPQHDPCVGPGVPSAQGIDGCKTTPLGQNWTSAGTYW